MHNGGIKSFTFHSSPRMVPHICKPQAQFVELSIEQFITRGKKSKDDSMHRSPGAEKLLDEEKDLIGKYFKQAKDDIWKPSLLAFPSFQSFPSRVHALRHSFRTTAMLIDAMQHLQGLALSEANKASSLMEIDTLHQTREVASAAVGNNLLASFHDTEAISQEKASAFDKLEGPFKETPEAKNRYQIPSHPVQNFSSHCFLFGKDFVSVDSLGGVVIGSVPCLPHKKSAVSNSIPLDDTKEWFANTDNDTCSFKAAALHHGKLAAQANNVVEAQTVVEPKLFQTDGILISESFKFGAHGDGRVEKVVLQTPVSRQKHVKQEYSVSEATVKTENDLCGAAVLLSDGALNNRVLSPRLTHFIREGVVPESPIFTNDHSFKEENEVSLKVTPIPYGKGSLAKYQSANARIKEGSMVPSSRSLKDELPDPLYASPPIMKLSGASCEGITSTDRHKMDNMQNNLCESSSKRSLIYSPINDDVRTQLGNPVNNSPSEDWQQISGEASRSSLPAPKYKRLRKYGDMAKSLFSQTSKDKDNYSPPTTFSSVRDQSNCMKRNKGKGEKKKKFANSFIEEEAEVSQDAEISEDEEDGEHEDRYDDSFIEDGANHTEVSTASTDAETCGGMMAFYRRSLLTQSPAECMPNCLATPHEESLSTRTAETESCSLQNGLQSVTQQVDLESTAKVRESSTKGFSSIESRKRKLSFQRSIGFMTPTNSPLKDISEAEHSAKALQQQQQPGSNHIGSDLLCDDDFYRCLDLDAVEEQATKLLKNKSSLEFLSDSARIDENFNVDLICSPSFDLGA